ncbi:MAG: pilus (MSHA type) biogenesis protein MshL, partial [Woeseiaceae bacterium]|nr:pilus (MSHA type) biogenesis protein MshL [Woeseiaceae bacterium]
MFKKLITGFTAAALLMGCATSMHRGEATRVGIDEALAEAAMPPVTPAEVAAALLPEVGVELPDAATNNERFDVDTDKTPARTFFMALVKGTPYNMVVHPDVSGKISLSMTSVTVPQVLEVVSDVYGYEVRETRTGFVVLPAAIQSRIFQIDYLNLTRSGIS